MYEKCGIYPISYGGEVGAGHISVRLLQTDCGEKLKGKTSAVLLFQDLSTGKEERVAAWHIAVHFLDLV